MPIAPDTVYQGSSGTAANASASSEDGSLNWPATKAWNGTAESGDSNETWISGTPGPWWWQVDLGSVIADISCARYCRRAHANHSGPAEVEILVSDTGAFAGEETSLGVGTFNDAAQDTWTNWLFPDGGISADGQYVRIVINTRHVDGSGSWVAMQEVEIGAGGIGATTRLLTLDEKAILIDEGEMPGRLTGESVKGLTVAEIETLLGATAIATADVIAKFGASGELTPAHLTGANGGIVAIHSATLADDASTSHTLACAGAANRGMLIFSSDKSSGYGFFFVDSNQVITAFQTGSNVAFGTAGTNPDTDGLYNIWSGATGQIDIKNRTGASKTHVFLEVSV